MKIWTVLDLLEWTESYFEQSGLETPRLDAEVLLGFVLEKSRLQLYLNFEMPVFPDHLIAYRELVKKRGNHTPVSYLTNCREFMSLNFYVDQRVLIPRPETENLVEYVLDQPERANYSTSKLVDIGTGSGAIAVSLAVNRPNWKITATDISKDALTVAEINAIRHGAQDQINFQQGNLLKAVANSKVTFDWIVSNPPYVSYRQYEKLQPDVHNYEPRLALVSGQDGLQLIRQLISDAPLFLKPEGKLAIEIGYGQRQAVEELAYQSSHYQKIHFLPDLTGTDRILIAET